MNNICANCHYQHNPHPENRMENIKMMLAEIDNLNNTVAEILSVADIDVEESEDESKIPALHEEYTSRMNRLRGMVMAHVK